MSSQPPRFTLTDTLFPDTTLFRSSRARAYRPHMLLLGGLAGGGAYGGRGRAAGRAASRREGKRMANGEAGIFKGYRGLVLLLLLGVYVLNYVDRQIVGILAEPIKKDPDLSDTQLGMMGGLAFAVFYSTLGIPLPPLAHPHR